MDNVMGHLDGDRICDFAEGTLDPALRAEAETHLKGCADCRRELETARGYLREMSALTAIDPIKAPPNFLANVRARLPQPSPVKRLLGGFLRSFRALPMQVALLTVLGLTAISSYLYQRGGLHESPPIVPISETSSTPGEAALEPAPGQSASLPTTAAPPPPAMPAGRAAPRPPAKTAARAAAENKARSVAGTGKKGSAKAEEMGQLGDAPASEYMSLRVPAPQPSAAGGRSDKPAYEELESLSMKDEAPISASGGASPAAAADKDEGVRYEPKAKSPAAKGLPGFSLRLDRGKRSADVLAGLKAIGAELVSGPERVTGGMPPGDGYVLLVPAAMVKDLPAYLARYGRAERAGDLPVREPRVRILLRLVPSPK